jgi:diguanylate cyclase (GGDEF)-like protein
MRARVALYTGVLSFVVAVAATVITGLLLRLMGIETATVEQAMLVCALMCGLLAPPVLGPLVWLAFRLREVSAELRRAAMTDPLTGVGNRRAFFEGAAQRLRAADEGDGRVRFAVLMIDVDRFKALNDRLGHDAGDAALAFVAGRITDSLARAGEGHALVGRIGGEEFAVLLEGVQIGGAKRAAEAICRGLRTSAFEHRGARVRVTASIGVWAGEADAVGIGLAAADRAVYAAKAAGRDRWEAAEVSDGPSGGDRAA